jgi:hypothetical protein
MTHCVYAVLQTNDKATDLSALRTWIGRIAAREDARELMQRVLEFADASTPAVVVPRAAPPTSGANPLSASSAWLLPSQREVAARARSDLWQHAVRLLRARGRNDDADLLAAARTTTPR